jgi:hypothetical protein
MKRLLVALAAFVLISNALTVSQASPRLANSGSCFNGASWEFTAQRSNNIIRYTLTFGTVQPNSLWNINYSYIPINTVDNRAVRASSKGVVTVNTRVVSSRPVTAFFWIESWAPSTVLYCAGALTV